MCEVERIPGEIVSYTRVPEIQIILHKPMGYVMIEWAVSVGDVGRPGLKTVQGCADAKKSTLVELLEEVLKKVKKEFPSPRLYGEET